MLAKLHKTMKYKCNTCHKEYTNKGSCKRHETICEFTHAATTDREKQVILEETTDLPSHAELVAVVQDIVLQHKRMQMRIVKLEKETSIITKEKIDPIKWLHENVVPLCDWKSMVSNLTLNINLTDNMFQDKMIDVFSKAVNNVVHKNESPIAFIKKDLYCYDGNKWQIISKNELITLCNKIHTALVNQLHTWRQENINAMDKSDALSIKYNKTFMKLLSINFIETATWNKAYSIVAECVKFDIKNIIEYVIE